MTATAAPSPLKKTMRDAFIEEVLKAMDAGENIFFLSADFGAPALDQVRERHPNKFINVGIAEQNLINVATGLALEGITVYAYAIAPFITMRCYEQIRVNVAILSQLRPMNINLVGVGAGFSYEVSGPTHHCLEDISIMRTLPNFEVISPADFITAGQLFKYTLGNKSPKYLRFDAKPMPMVHESIGADDLKCGFKEMSRGGKTCLVSTGVLTHRALEVKKHFESKGQEIGIIDMIKLKGFDSDKILTLLKRYEKVITLEEGFIGKGGLDAAMASLILESGAPLKMRAMGLKDQYHFHMATRESLHKKNNLDVESIAKEAI